MNAVIRNRESKSIDWYFEVHNDSPTYMFRINVHADKFSNLASPAQFPQNLSKSLQSREQLEKET